MISQGLHKPGKILIVTYMNSAVNNFKQRISRELARRGITGNKDYVVCTIHSLCLRIVKEKPDLISASEDFDIIDEVSKFHLISTAVDEWRKKNDDIFRYYLEDSGVSASKQADYYRMWSNRFCGVVLSAIGDFKIHGLNPEQAMEKCSVLPESSFLKQAADIYAIYDRKLKIDGLLDFDDMLYSAKRLLTTDESLLQKYRSKFSFVCEDEAQDSNLIQSEILTMIANGNLLRVGDSNQAICGSFSNSDFKLFKEFCEMPETTVYRITQSSRNTREIIDLANYFVKYVRERHPVPECRDSLLPQFIEPVDQRDEARNPVTTEYGIKARVFKSWEEEVNSVVTEVIRMLKRHPDKTISVLVPTSFKMRDIVSCLEERNIPFEQLDNTSDERNRTIRILGRIIDFIAEPENCGKFTAMMMDCFLAGKYEDELPEIEFEPDKQSRTSQRKMLAEFLGKYPVEKILYPAAGEIDLKEIPQELIKTKIWKDFIDKLDLVRDLLEFPPTVVEKLILYISEKLNFDREERAIAQKVAGDVRYLMNQSPRWRLSDLAFELLSPKNKFNFFAGIVWELKGYEPKPGVVTVATYHKSKGLEWDIVFLTGLNYADFPVTLSDRFVGEYWFLREEYKNPQALVKADMNKILGIDDGEDSILKSKIETISERARLLYVGITRAKEYLYLSGFHANEGKRNENLPSKYLLELKQYIEEVGAQWSGI